MRTAFCLVKSTGDTGCAALLKENNLLGDTIIVGGGALLSAAANPKSDGPVISLVKEDVLAALPSTGNGAADRNAAIDMARKAGYDRLFIVDDHVVPLGMDTFRKYEGLMDMYKTGMVFYGYGKGANKVMDVKPNPGLVMSVGEGKEVQTSRFICDAFVLLDLSRAELFDERFKISFFKEYVSRAAKKGLIPFNGFFLDVNDSWKLFKDVPPRPLTKAEQEEQHKIVRGENQLAQNEGINNNVDNKIDDFVNFLWPFHMEVAR